MYFYELFSHSDRFAHRAHLLSSASCVLILCTALTLLPPFLLTYYTGDFWLQESVYSEQPRLDSNPKFVLIVDNDGADGKFFLSSYSNLNSNFQSRLVTGGALFASSDTDGDGLIDQLSGSFDITLASTTTNIRSVNLWLIFQYELRGKQRITMETMALVDFVPVSTLQPSSNQNLTIYGQLTFQQRKTIRNAGNDSTYNKSIISTDSSSLPNLDSILNDYFLRDYYTSFQTQYTSLTPRATTTSAGFTVTVVVNVGRQAIRYMPGFWQAFKWGWIQYICVLLPFIVIFRRLKLFVFSNHLVRTLVPLPNHRHKA